MRFYSLWKVVMAGLGCGLLAAACSAPDPGAVTITDKTPHVGANASSGASGQTSSGTSGQTSSGASGSSGASSSGDAGSSGVVDAGFDSGPPPLAAFKGDGAYVATAGQSATNAGHGGAANLPPSHDCFSCHKNGGAAAEMAMGGYVKTAAGNPVSKAEVRVVDSAGVELAKAYTESNGFFYVLGTAITAAGAKTGVRNASIAKGMTGAATGGCASGNCHGGAQGDITLAP